MTENGIIILQSLFQDIWRLFNSWYLPGTHMTPATLFFLALFITLVYKFISLLFFQNDDSDNGGRKH